MTYISPEPLGLFAQLACLWEATARKAGNVHRFQDFEDVTYLDFVASAAAIAPVFDELVVSTAQGQSDTWSVGALVYDGVLKTRQVARTNTNLGILLLLAPLATASWPWGERRAGVLQVLEKLTVRDAIDVYQAIRLAAPGGLGQVDDQDVSQLPTQTLRQVMTLAADRDLIALQYANGFQEVFLAGVPALQRGLEETGTLEHAIIGCHLQLLARYADSLIARKCGLAVAQEASHRAARVIDAGWPHTAAGHTTFADLDAWLRADGHRRNPGTTADLVAASLFAALREGIITLPLQVLWSCPAEALPGK
jgi:triphosphoribosyl-dephospho-CoA synthase